VNAALDTIAARNKNIKYMQGYRIQLYVGNSRDEANAAKAYLYQNFPELNAYMSFTQPTYRLKVGDFMSKIDAERYHVSMKQEYSASMIVPDKIDIRKSLLTK
jgi:LysM repeat protein